MKRAIVVMIGLVVLMVAGCANDAGSRRVPARSPSPLTEPVGDDGTEPGLAPEVSPETGAPEGDGDPSLGGEGSAAADGDVGTDDASETWGDIDPNAPLDGIDWEHVIDDDEEAFDDDDHRDIGLHPMVGDFVVETMFPTEGSVVVGLHSTEERIVITLSKLVHPDTIEGGIALSDEEGRPIAFDILEPRMLEGESIADYEARVHRDQQWMPVYGRKIVLDAGSMNIDRTYHIEVGGIRTTEGQSMTEPFSGSFSSRQRQACERHVPGVPEVTNLNIHRTPMPRPSIVARFTESIDPSTLDEDTFYLMDANRRRIAAEEIVYTDGCDEDGYYPSFTAQFRVAENLNYEGEYTAVVTSDVCDVDGDCLSDAMTATVHMLPQHPVVASVRTRDDDKVGVCFDRPMEEATFTDESVTIVNEYSNEPVALEGIRFQHACIVIVPDAWLNRYNRYRLTLTTAITDADGQPLERDYVHTFEPGDR